MHQSIEKITSVAVAEARTAVRQMRFWTATVVVTVVAGFGYAFSCLSLHFIAPYTPTTTTPFYLLGKIEPTYFLILQLIALMMVFDSSYQQTKNRINEVLDSRPVSNFEYCAGRTLGNALLLWVLSAVLVLTAHTFGLVMNLAGFGFAEGFQSHSLLNLLMIDVPSMLLIWCSFTVFLSSALRFRVAVVVVGIFMMSVWLFLLLNSPFALLGIVTASSNDVLFISDLVPQFPRWETLAVRFGTVMGAIALIFAATIFCSRRDRTPVLSSVLACGIGATLCACAYGIAILGAMKPSGQAQEWLSAHQEVQWNGEVDVQEISGHVHINPGRRLEIDLSLAVNVGDMPVDELVFSFNPSMNIIKLELDELPTDFRFENGLLRIPIGDPPAPTSNHTLKIRASGIPDVRFAYFDSTIDYMNSNDTSTVAASLMGTDGSVFTGDYVALMPGNHWYPTPGPVNSDYESMQRGLDYFRVNLEVSLARDGWTLVALGSERDNESTRPVFKVSPANPVHEIGLFASDFVSSRLDVNDLRLDIHLTQRHSRNLKLPSYTNSEFQPHFERRLQRFIVRGISPSHAELALVEVPGRLRTIGGGWRMNSANSMPGIFMMKEHGFPRARIDSALKRIEKQVTNETDQIEAQLQVLYQFFNSPILTENLWLSLPDRFWTHSTTARGKHAQAIDQMMRSLTGMLFELEVGYSSIYATLFISSHTHMNPDRTVWASEDSLEGFSGGLLWNDLDLISDYATRASVRSNVEQMSFADLPTSNGNQIDLEFMLLKSKEIARGFILANGNESVVAWLSSIQHKFAGTNYTLDQVVTTAEQFGLIVEPFLTNWIENAELPGYKASVVKNSRISDTEDGKPRWIASVDVRNTEKTPGLFVIKYPGSARDEWDFPLWDDSDPVFIDGESAKRVNLLTPVQLTQMLIDPILSLNRHIWNLEVQSVHDDEVNELDLPPFVEESSWTPNIDEIIVDDLSAGFHVIQSEADYSQPLNIGPVSWFREPLLQLDFDSGLPVLPSGWYQDRPGRWHRTQMWNAHGSYRKTAAVTRIEGNTFNVARFATELPETSVWNLEYHLPFHIEYGPGGREYKYQFVVDDGENSKNAILDLELANLGWNDVGMFELKNGPVHVDLVGVSDSWRHHFVYADAIRWKLAETTTPTERPDALENQANN